MTKSKVKPVPEGFHSATPYLVVDGAAKALDFYKHVFDATERMRLPAPGGRVGHAEIKIGDSVIMLADEHHDMGARGPRAYGGTPVSLVLYVPDVDATVKKAVSAGAKVINAGRGQVLRRPHGHHRGSLWPPLARGHASGGRAARRAGSSGVGDEQAGLENFRGLVRSLPLPAPGGERCDPLPRPWRRERSSILKTADAVSCRDSVAAYVAAPPGVGHRHLY